MPSDKFLRQLEQVTHVILKFGTGTLTEHIKRNSRTYFKQIADEVKQLQAQGKKVIIVSSGAVGFGREILHRQLKRVVNHESVGHKQALASLGQSLLIDTYRSQFSKKQLAAAQILLTRTDFENRKHLANLRQTLDQLLDWNAVPVINENDAIANEEIKVGDNDNLSADIAVLYPHSLLILLTTIDGFYMDKKRLPVINRIDASIKRAAGVASGQGTGGMITKLQAGQKILQAGQMMNIASGKNMRVLRKIMNGEDVGTWFY